jgi:hypothetical protein
VYIEGIALGRLTARTYKHPIETKTEPKASPKNKPDTHNSKVMAKPNAPNSTAIKVVSIVHADLMHALVPENCKVQQTLTH